MELDLNILPRYLFP